MTTSVEKVIDGFATPTLTRIIGMPDYESIKVMNDELTGNAFGVNTNLGCGTVGYSRLTLSPAVYATISATPFVAPLNPGVQAVIPTGSTQIQITSLNRTFDTSNTLYQEYLTVGNALKKQLLASVDDIYLCALKQPYVLYGNVTVLELLTHLYTTYARITPGDLERNNEIMTKPWDPNLPVEFLFKQIEDATAYADHGGAPLTDVQVVNKAYTLVYNTGLFPDECKDWSRLTLTNQTWIDFKATFALAHQEWRESQTQTAGNTYGAVNNLEEHTTSTANAINALANATAADKATIIALSNAVQNLTTQLATCQSQLAAAKAGTATGKKWDKPKSPYEPNRHYCWTCGFDSPHSSSNCPKKATGHIDHVNWRNTKGGSDANKK